MGKRIIPQRRGRGSVYRSPSHKHKGRIIHPKIRDGTGKVVELMHDPGHSAPVAQVLYDNGEMVNMVAAEGIYVGQTVMIGGAVPLEIGNTAPIGRIPEGVMIYNVEAKPGDGGKFARAAGLGAVIVSQGKVTTVKLPSEQFKALSPDCMATIGMTAGGGRGDKPYAKAGKNFYACQSKSKRHKKVRGVAMNAADHPHGGGRHQHVGRPSTVSRNAPPGRKVGRLSPKKNSANRKLRAGRR